VETWLTAVLGPIDVSLSFCLCCHHLLIACVAFGCVQYFYGAAGPIFDRIELGRAIGATFAAFRPGMLALSACGCALSMSIGSCCSLRLWRGHFWCRCAPCDAAEISVRRLLGCCELDVVQEQTLSPALGSKGTAATVGIHSFAQVLFLCQQCCACTITSTGKYNIIRPVRLA
jgi:hypothetical protein